jgi:hypothetical protein
MKIEDLDIQLYNDLDESVLNSIGQMTPNFEYSSNFCCGADGMYSNQDGDGDKKEGGESGTGTKLSPESIQAGIQLGATVAQGIQQSQANKRASGQPTRKEIKAVCGKKPLFGKAKKDAYKKCRENYIANRNKALGGAGGGGNISPDMGAGNRITNDTEGDKFLGMPKGVGIAVAVLGGLALVAGGIYLVKKMNK